MQLREHQKGFGPVYTKESRVLILGSYPSPKSFEAAFYYGHPQNRFWPLMAALLDAPVPASTEQKAALIRQNGLALWDSLESCRILGAADGSIQDPVPNDIAALVAQTRIQAVLCNGAAAYKYYKRFSEQKTGIRAVQLPSTSPANAAWSFARLAAAWGEALVVARR